jgi:hypothetical protein
MATIGCGISHKESKHTDICSNNKTKTAQKQNEETIQNTVKITQRKFDMKYTHIIQDPHKKQ